MATLETLLQQARQAAQDEQEARERAEAEEEQERRIAILEQLDHNLDRALGAELRQALGGAATLSAANAARLVTTVRGQRITLSHHEDTQRGQHWAIDVDAPIDGPVVVRELDYNTELTFRQRLLLAIDQLTIRLDEH